MKEIKSLWHDSSGRDDCRGLFAFTRIMKEIWKEVKGASLQKVSTKGRVIGQRGNQIGSVCKKGYVNVTIILDDGKKCYTKVHRIVYSTFKGEILKGYDIHHKDKNPSNNDISNLMMVTHYGNLILDKGTGITTRSNGRTWRGRYKNKHLGTFGTKLEATMAFLNLLQKEHPVTYNEVIEKVLNSI